MMLTVPALVGGDEAKVLALCFRAFSHTAADTALELVRGPDALVSLLQLNGHCEVTHVKPISHCTALDSLLETESPMP